MCASANALNNKEKLKVGWVQELGDYPAQASKVSYKFNLASTYQQP